MLVVLFFCRNPTKSRINPNKPIKIYIIIKLLKIKDKEFLKKQERSDTLFARENI